MRLVYFLIFLFLSSHTQAFLYSSLPQFQAKKDQSRVVLNASYRSEEVENDKDASSLDYEIENSLIDLQYHFQIKKNILIGIDQGLSRIDSNRGGSETVIHDPHFQLWWQVKDDQASSGASGEVGFELSPSLSEKNIYKIKNGNLAAIKYRFGVHSDVDRAYVTYIVGVKDGGRFLQNNQSYKYPSNTFWGARIWYERDIGEAFKGHLGAFALKNSQNQAQVFYQTDYHDSSWLTRLNAGASYSLKENYKLSFDYEIKNESSAFGKLGRNQDFEHDHQQFSLSLSALF